MIDFPPPPPLQCVKVQEASRTAIKAILVASGDPAQLEEWLKEVKKRKLWTVDTDASSPTFRAVRLVADGALPYREIGGLIYDGQARRLTISFQLTPPICEAEDE